jgi:hypothetical protein
MGGKIFGSAPGPETGNYQCRAPEPESRPRRCHGASPQKYYGRKCRTAFQRNAHAQYSPHGQCRGCVSPISSSRAKVEAPTKANSKEIGA